MATSWSYNGWRRESGSTAQRAMLILHIEEVEQYLAAFKSQGAADQSAGRYDLEAYLKRLEEHLAKYDEALDLDLLADADPLVMAKPRI